jgi:hypothetical protein
VLIAPTWVVEAAASGNNAAATQLAGALATTLNTLVRVRIIPTLNPNI